MAKATTTQILTTIKEWVLGRIAEIAAVIPSQASSSNQLADKAFVNSSIATATATFRGTYNLVSDLSLTTSATQQQIAAALATKMTALSIVPDANDYAFVQVPAADATPTVIARVDRYKFNGSAWAYEYSLNNSGFTAAQWAAINSGATLELIGKLAALPTNAELITLLNAKASKVTNATAGNLACLDAGGNLTDSGIGLGDNGAYDVTAHNSGATFASLSALLSSQDLSTLIPVAVRKGGMSIKFVLTSDNKYVQYMYNSASTTAADFTNEANWEKINLETEVRELNRQVNGTIEEDYEEQTLTEYKFYNTKNDPLTEWPSVSEGTYCGRYAVSPGDKFIITGLGGNQYSYLYATTDSSRNKVRHATSDENCRITPKEITIEEGEAYLYVNLTSYNSSTDKVQKAVATHVSGLEDRVTALEEERVEVTDEVGSSSAKAASQKLATEIKAEAEEAMEAIEQLSSDIHGTTEEEYRDMDISWYQGMRYTTKNDPMPESYSRSEGCYCKYIEVTPGEKYRIYGKGGDTNYALLYAVTNSTRYKTREATVAENCRINPKELTIVEGEKYLYINLAQYDAATDKVQKLVEVHTTGLEDRVEVLEEEVDNTIEICVPSIIYAVVGDTLQMYYRGIFKCPEYTNYGIRCICNIGKAYPRYYELTPAAGDIGSHTVTFEIRDSNGRILGTAERTIIVVASGSSPSSNLNVLCVGASATNGGEWPSELKRRLTGSGGAPTADGKTNITFVGRKSVTYNGETVNLEATGGYNFNSYISVSTLLHRFNIDTESQLPNLSIGDVYSYNGNNYTVYELNLNNGYFSCTGSTNPGSAGGTLTKVSGAADSDATIAFTSASSSGNPFAYNGEVDVEQYAEDYCNGHIDVIICQCFGNGLLSQAYESDADIDSGLENSMMPFINQFRAVSPNCKFIIGGLYLPDMFGGLGKNYGALATYQYYAQVYTRMRVVNKLQKYIDDNNLGGYVSICNWTGEMDNEYDFRKTTKAINTRISTTEPFGINGLHPGEPGYFQMADAIYRLFIAKFCQNV